MTSNKNPKLYGLSINEINELSHALDYAIGFMSDNSCSDPECCGGPWYTRDHFEESLAVMERFGLTFDPDQRAE